MTSVAGLLLMALPGIAPLRAQAPVRYDRYERLSLWNSGRNEAGIRLQHDAASGRYANSYAEVHGGGEGGGFRQSWESSSSWNAGARTESVLHLPGISMRGSFSFEQCQGRNMSGSMFVHPGFYPIDIQEFTPGVKNLQTYTANGGVAVPLGERWILGGRLAFESANYAKRKDLRHTNYRLDLTVLPSVLFRTESWVFGLSGIYRKTSEWIKAEQIGTATATSYYVFLDKGLFYGSREVWDGSGVHLNEAGVNRLPVKEHVHGAALQLEKRLGGTTCYADGEYLHSAGSVGERDYLWYTFPGRAAAARAGCVWSRPKATHSLIASIRWNAQRNQEYVTEKITEGGITTPHHYGSNRIFERKTADWSLDYVLDSDKWELETSLQSEWLRMRSTLVYPCSDTFDGMLVSGRIDLMRHIGPFDLKAGAGLALPPRKAASELKGVDSAVPPYRYTEGFQIWKDRNFGTVLSGNLAVRYNVQGGPLAGLYLEPYTGLTHGTGWEWYDGCNRIAALLTIGYSFGTH